MKRAASRRTGARRPASACARRQVALGDEASKARASGCSIVSLRSVAERSMIADRAAKSSELARPRQRRVAREVSLDPVASASTRGASTAGAPLRLSPGSDERRLDQSGGIWAPSHREARCSTALGACRPCDLPSTSPPSFSCMIARSAHVDQGASTWCHCVDVGAATVEASRGWPPARRVLDAPP